MSVTRVTERSTIVRANNPGIMELEGTNTLILREPGSRGVAVVDPGPLLEDHLEAILEVVASDGGRVELVIYTHHHDDHTGAIDRFAELTGAPARAIGADWCRDAEPVVDGEDLDVDGLAIRVMATPGHTMDSLCLLLPDDRSLATGDTILGRGTTVVAHPDGALGPYLDSLHALRAAIDAASIEWILPAHGPVIDRPAEVLDFYIAHRQERLQQVRDALDAGDTTPREVVERVYADVDPILWDAAEMSVRAQLDYLRA